MNWINGLQNAIDYMEDHLTEELDYGEIARQAYSSSFHFQRVFHILCGYTLGEYIRFRRLTRAGSDLISSQQKVIDIALGYGYDNPESFTRAFTKFHGVTPSQARVNGTGLKSFSRLSVKLQLEGGTMMDYRIEKKDTFQMIVKKKHFPKGEIGKEQIHAMWAECARDDTIPTLCRYAQPDDLLGDNLVGVSFDSPEEEPFDYAIGLGYHGGDIADGFSVETIPAHTWAIFPCEGPMPEAFQSLWNAIYTEFFPTSEYQPAAGGLCLELYPSDNVSAENYRCEFWLSVAKR